MSTIATRKAAGLEQKTASLEAEFEDWLALTEKDREFEKHHSQVRALVGHLNGLRSRTSQIFEQAKKDGILAEARNLESLLLGIRRIWEFFRSKLMQRREPKMRHFLQLADELAWACYQPVLKVAGPKARREPPLVFLNGGLSPYALSRDHVFSAEDVTGEALAGSTWEPVLKRLPIPVIGVPWYQTAHLPDLPVVAHETGHTLEEDFGLHDSTLRNLESRLKGTPGAARLACWQAWSGEIFADLWGCLTLGPAFVGSLMDFLAIDRKLVENEIATDHDKYPATHLRIELCIEALGKLKEGGQDFAIEQSKVRTLWIDEYNAGSMSDFKQDVPFVVEAILGSGYSIDGKDWLLTDIPDLRFTPEHWGYAKKAAAEACGEKLLESAVTATQLVAAARFLFEQDPAKYAQEKYGQAFAEHIQAIVKPGRRAGEAVLKETEKEKLSEASFAFGKSWFEDFSRWAGASGATGAE